MPDCGKIELSRQGAKRANLFRLSLVEPFACPKPSCVRRDATAMACDAIAGLQPKIASTRNRADHLARSRRGRNTTQARPARIRINISQRVAEASWAALSAGHWNLNWRRRSARSIIQCQPV